MAFSMLPPWNENRSRPKIDDKSKSIIETRGAEINIRTRLARSRVRMWILRAERMKNWRKPETWLRCEREAGLAILYAGALSRS